MKFKNIQNNHTEEVCSSLSWLWVLCLGPIYWATQGIWRHVVAHTLIAIATFGIGHAIYPFFTTQ